MLSSVFDSNNFFSNDLQYRVIEHLNVRNNLCRFYFENKNHLDALLDYDKVKRELSPYYCNLDPYNESYILLTDLDVSIYRYDIDSNDLKELSVLYNNFFKSQINNNFSFLKVFLNKEWGCPDVLTIRESFSHGIMYDHSLNEIIDVMEFDAEFVRPHKNIKDILDSNGYLTVDFDVTFDFFYGFINRLETVYQEY